MESASVNIIDLTWLVYLNIYADMDSWWTYTGDISMLLLSVKMVNIANMIFVINRARSHVNQVQ